MRVGIGAHLLHHTQLRIVRRQLIGCNIAAVTGGVTEVTPRSVLDKYDTISDDATSTRYCIDELIDIYIKKKKKLE